MDINTLRTLEAGLYMRDIAKGVGRKWWYLCLRG